MRICVIGTRGFPLVEGGVEKHCEAIYPRIAKHAEVIVFRRRPYVHSREHYDGIRFIDLPTTTIKGFETVFHSLLATCRALSIKPDVVHYHNIGPALFSPLLKLRHIPVVLTYHSPNYEHSKWGAFARRLLRFSEKVALKNARQIIFVSKSQMGKYPDNVKGKSSYVPNGVARAEFVEGSDLLEKHGLEVGKYILSVGRITPEKGFDTLVKAFAEANIEGFKLAIVGGVETESSYKRELDTLKAGLPVVFTGQIHGADLAQLYQNAALYVLASRNEGSPLVLLEALSYGLDVLVSDIPATHLVELADDDYCAVDDVNGFASGIQRKASNHTRRAYNLEKFDWNNIADKTFGIYEAAIRKASVEDREGPAIENSARQ